MTSTILSRVEYGSMAYENASNTNLKKLDPIMNNCMRLITGAFRTTKTVNLNAELGMIPLEFKREIAIGKKAIQILATRNHPLHNKINDTVFDHKITGKVRIRPPFYYRARKILEYNNIPMNIYSIKTTKCEPWTVKNLNTDLQLTSMVKNQLSKSTIKKLFQEFVQKYKNHQHIYTDGSKNNEKTGCGYLLNNTEVKHRLLDNTSIFSAELFAILKFIREINSKSTANNFAIFTDSQSAVYEQNKMYPTNTIAKEILWEISKRRQMKYTIIWIPGHADITGNEKADFLAKESLKIQCSENARLSVEDAKIILKNNVMKRWSDLWKDEPSKNLRKIKDNIKKI